MNLKELAKLTGYSVSIVSRALSQIPEQSNRVSEKTREKILKIAKENGYKRDIYASSIRRKINPSIAIFHPRGLTCAMADIMIGLTQEATLRNIPLSFYYPLTNDNFLDVFKENLKKYSYQTYIIRCQNIHANHCEEEFFDIFKQHCAKGGKILFMNEALYSKNIDELLTLPKNQVSTISYDDFCGGEIAAQYLIDKKCNDFVAIAINNVYSIKRTEGFKSVIVGNNLECELLIGEKLIPLINEFIDKKLSLKIKPCGIFVSTDKLALYFLECARAKGYIHRKDFYLIGYNNDFTIHNDAFEPFATIAQDYFTQSRVAIALATKMLYGEFVEPVVFKPELIDNRSNLSVVYQTNQHMKLLN